MLKPYKWFVMVLSFSVKAYMWFIVVPIGFRSCFALLCILGFRP